MKFIIEHLEPKLYPWCLIEYQHISQLIGRKNLLFTNLKTKPQQNKLRKIGAVSPQSVLNLSLKKACLLDPQAKKTLTPQEAKTFSSFVFGGILGDEPPKKRTAQALGHLKAEKRNLGSQQMSTDTAVYVVKEILQGKRLAQLKFVEPLIIPVKKGEEIILPFRYLLVKNQPLLPKGLVPFIKKKGF